MGREPHRFLPDPRTPENPGERIAKGEGLQRHLSALRAKEYQGEGVYRRTASKKGVGASWNNSSVKHRATIRANRRS